MSRRQRRASGRVVAVKTGGVRKRADRVANRVERKRLLVAARRAATEAARSRPPRHVAIVCAGVVSRTAASEFASKLADTGVVARVVPVGINAALDEALVADALVILFGTGELELDDVAVSQLVAIRSQGLPGDIVAATVGEVDRNSRRHRSRVLAAYSLGDERSLRTVGDVSALARRLTQRVPKEIAWRARYGYVAVESCSAVRDGEVALVGWLRGRGLSANELVHITGFGSFVCARVVHDVSDVVLSQRVESEAEDPASIAVPDCNMGEQTWIPEIEADGDEYFAEGEEGNMTVEDEADMGEGNGSDGSMGVEEDSLEDDDDLLQDEDDNMDIDEEMQQLRENAETDAQFPDEVDTPVDQAARVRFARYRGLKSFRTSEWDPKEQLPRDYASLFQFRNLKSTRKRVLAQAADVLSKADVPNFAKPGRRVRVHLSGVDASDAGKLNGMVSRGEMVVLSGMLKHENKRSVVHFGVTRIDEENEDDTPIKAKSHMAVQSGFVRFEGRPMFSEQNSNSDKHKMHRFLTHSRYTVVSMYGPAVYAPAPALLFRDDGRLVASGSALGADPDRIILKRIVLTGYPYKTQKRKSVAKLMFFNADDIRWFRPVELWTKLGRTGHILEPMGTKGHMKCIFDSPLLHHDTVCMTLYKRVYPKLIDTA